MRTFCVLIYCLISYSVAAQPTWKPVRTIFGGTIDRIAFPSPNSIVEGTSTGVYLSSDRGAHWEAVLDSTIVALEVGPNGHVYALGRYRGLYRSTTGGATWTLLPVDPTPDQAYSCLAVSSTDSIAVGSRDYLYVSADEGNSWSWKQLDNVGGNNEIFTYTSFDKFGNLYASYRPGFKRSTDYGQTWTKVEDVEGTVTLPNGLILGLFGSVPYLAYSRDSGQRWSFIDTGYYHPTTRLVLDSNHALAYFHNRALLRSYDGGLTAHYVADGPANIWNFAVGPSGEYYADSAYMVMYRSMDSGLSWSKISPPPIYSPTMQRIFRGPGHSMFALFSSPYPGPGLNYAFSLDDGATWTERSLDTGRDPLITQIIGHPDGSVYALGNRNLYHSVDLGQTWKKVVPPDSSLTQFGIDSSGVIYLTGARDSINLSSDGGQTWEKSSSPIHYTTYRADRLGSMYARNGSHLMLSNDHGKTWSSADVLSTSFGNYGISSRSSLIGIYSGSLYRYLPTSHQWSPIVGPHDLSSVLIFGTNSDIYTSSESKRMFFWSKDDGATWDSILISWALENHLTGAAVTDSGVLYAAADNGIFYLDRSAKAAVPHTVSAANGDLNVWPNPSDGRFTISPTDKISALEIVDMLGRVLWSKNGIERDGPIAIDLRGVAPGLYYGIATINGESSVRKIVMK